MQKLILLNKVDWLLSNGEQFHFTVARLDAIHPVVSGNKFFKLKYNLQKAVNEKKKGILTMGGAFSNHLAATAYACNKGGLKSAGIIRGEIVQPLNSTLSFCEQNNMQLLPVNRNQYNQVNKTIAEIKNEFAEYLFVPEGADNAEGLKGCNEILAVIQDAFSYTHLLCSMGTGATFRGIAAAALAHQTVTGIPALKIKPDEQKLFIKNHATIETAAKKSVLFDFAGTGYAKYQQEQINFMNLFYTKTGIPTDIVYTGKLMQALITLAEQQCFEKEAGILVIHTGGLQGNKSLKQGLLYF